MAFLLLFTHVRTNEALLILEESEWNWGKFLWNLRLFYMHRNVFNLTDSFFLNITTQSFFASSSCRWSPTPITNRLFSWLYLVFVFLFFSPVYHLTHCETRSAQTHRRSQQIFFCFVWEKTHFGGFFFLLLLWWLKNAACHKLSALFPPNRCQ